MARVVFSSPASAPAASDEEPPPPPPARSVVRHAGILATVLLLLVAVAASPLAAEDLPPTDCYEVGLSQPLLWVTSGVWSSEGETLLVVDVLREAVLQVSARGDVTIAVQAALVSAAGGSPTALTRPSTIRATADGYLLEDEQLDEILRLNSHLEWTASIRVKPKPDDKTMPAGTTLEAIYDWAPMGAGILAFGDRREPGGESWHSAFLYFDGSGQQVFESFATEAEVCNQYLRGMPYVATLEGVGYILFLDQRPAIGKIEVVDGVRKLRRLQYFPEDFRSRPRLQTRPEWASTGQGARQATHFYKIIEGSTMAAGLYAWDQHLYLLAKEAAADNVETTWWLIQLDPDDARELARVRLPTRAPHLTVVPGELWAFIEKGPVQGIGDTHAPYMDTLSMVLVPASWLGGPDGSRLGAESGVHCVALSP